MKQEDWDDMNKVCEELDTLKEKIEQIKAPILKLTATHLTEKDRKELTGWMQDRVELWCRIFNENSVVQNKWLIATWQKMGNDPRGLGGFYSGTGSLVKIPGDRVALSENVPELVHSWTCIPIEEYAKKFK